MPLKKQESNALSRIDEVRNLRDKVEELRNEKSNISAHLMSDRANRPSIAQRVTSLEGTVKNASTHDKASWEKLLDAAKQSINRIDASISSAEARLKEIDGGILQAEREIAERNRGASIKDFLSHVKAISDANTEVSRIEDIIAEQQQHLDAVSDDVDSKIESLQSRRQQLLADIALGTASADGLKSIDQEIDALLQDKDGAQRKASEVHRHVHQTIAGLRPRLEAAKQHKAELDGYTGELMEQVLRSEVEQVAVEYYSHAKAMIQSFEALVALDRIIQKVTGGAAASILAPAWWHMKVPAFAGDGANDVEMHDPGQGVLYSVQQALNDGIIDARVEHESQRLRKQGLEL